jgi:ABC-type branched-subunit amino acid transport system substrate-binding protein
MSAKKLIVLTLLAILLLSTFTCGGEGEEEEGITQLKFGIGLPLTGLAGTVVGIPAKYSFEMAAEKIGVFTVGGKQYRWNLIFEDNEFSASGGVASATMLIIEHGVKFMHQSCPSPAMTTIPIVVEAGDVLLDVSAVAVEALSPDTPNVFQVAGIFEVSQPPFWDWFVKEHPEVKSAVVVASDDVSGYTIADVAKACGEYYGLDVHSEHYPQGTTEFYPIATKVMALDADWIYADIAWLTLRELGYEGPGTTHLWFPAAADARGWDLFQGQLIYMPHPYGGLWPEAEAFAEEYEQRCDLELGSPALFAANVLYVYTDALRQAGTVDDLDKIIETLETGIFDTLVGPFIFGGEMLNGIGHLGIWPSPVFEVVGEHDYRVCALYSPEETVELMEEVFGAR